MMKLVFTVAMLAITGISTRAQLGTGGLPLSKQTGRSSEELHTLIVPLPDWNKGVKEWEAGTAARPYLVALTTSVDIGFPGSGTFYTSAHGERVWRTRINMAGAKGLGFYYDRFHLPQGVKFFLSNANGKQVLGAFTASNNDPSSDKFVTEAVLGDVVTLELNIDAGVNLNDIKLHIDKAAAYFRGLEYLQTYVDGDWETIDDPDTALTGHSSVCMINAVCPEGDNYGNQRNAAFQWLKLLGDGHVGMCSATMVNTTANAPGNCKQYLLLASHCDSGIATTSAAFDQVLLRYNFQHATCNPAAGTVPNTTRTLTGANFIARSTVDVNNPPTFKGDFLLLEARSAIPVSWGVNLAGWNNAADIPLTQTAPRKFIGFHHPGGDAKKVSSSQQIQSAGLAASDSHWGTEFDAGLIAQGTSGSALFDGDGRSIGIASVAPLGMGLTPACSVDALGNDVTNFTSKFAAYSKLSYIWDYDQDGTAAMHKLKPWLDPANTGATTTNTVKSDCTPLNGSGTAITNQNKLDDGLAIFPNPTTTGKVTLQLNLNEPSDLKIAVFDISGKKINSYSLEKIRSGSFTLDLSAYSNGMYLLQVSDGYNTAGRKVMLTK